MDSVWSDTVKLPGFHALKGDIKSDVLIIGGGMVGILCAYFLEKAGVNYVLAERKQIGNGITKNTTAKITSQHGLIYDKLIKKAGLEKAKMYLDANELAVRKFKELSGDISCDFEEKDAYIYSLQNKNIIEKEINAVNKLMHKAQFTQTLPLPFDNIAGAVKFENQAQFHPIKFIAGISQKLNIYENTTVKEFIGNNTVTTGTGTIKADKIIVATHFPFLNKHGAYFLKLYQHRSYVIALENAVDINGMYLEEKQNGLSFRNYHNLLFIGGGDHRTGKTGGNWEVLRDLAKNAYPNAVEKYAWATQDCMTLDDIPYIGNYSRAAPDLYVAAGFNKWGMTSSMVSAMILTDMITGRKNEFAEVFSPDRSILKPQLLINGLTAVGNLLNFYKKRCPHMGCALKWNKVEQSWDCKCHGSRFEKHGELIDNPATASIKFE